MDFRAETGLQGHINGRNSKNQKAGSVARDDATRDNCAGTFTSSEPNSSSALTAWYSSPSDALQIHTSKSPPVRLAMLSSINLGVSPSPPSHPAGTSIAP
mmetsp:Transcript_23798/g.65876  ORF Transcript_23798/g.65876 Transcript_23798/m.65876 type:complete len:100 (+) Transcript_23798:664-963(+)